MIRKSRPRSSSLFLMELILAILFFSVAGAVCVQLFIKAHLLSRDSVVLTRAVNVCTNAAEQFSASPDSFPGGQTCTYYDRDFFPCEKSDAAYILTVSTRASDDLINAFICVTSSDGETIYELEAVRHPARRTAYEKG